MSRFGNENQENIRKEVEKLVPQNTKRSKESVWRQFLQFCFEKSYDINSPSVSIEALSQILEDHAFNMKKKSLYDYKEGVVKVMWNSTAKQLKEMFFINYNIKFDPFTDPEFASARVARDAMRRKLQRDP
ncbi:unnamed protein product [Psylliodes chrysocephalus]|uniref:Uncharacterized protein n=1 Tax=Psylliodes chrysocephalus TaxID=3402493 RepID=A0A9P0GLY5_9CUCU|nr:unnamed protein product [Psylliodes chrysocephala]